MFRFDLMLLDLYLGGLIVLTFVVAVMVALFQFRFSLLVGLLACCCALTLCV